MAAAVCGPPGSARGLERCRERTAEAVSERHRAPVHGPARGRPDAELGAGAARPHPQPGRSRRRPRLAQLYSRAAPGGRVGSASRTPHPCTCTTSRCASTAASPRSRSSASCGWRERPATRSTGWCARRSPTSTAAGTWRSCADLDRRRQQPPAGVLGVHAGVAAVTASDGATLRADVMTDAERRRLRRLERTLSRRGLDNPHGRMQARVGRRSAPARHPRQPAWPHAGLPGRALGRGGEAWAQWRPVGQWRSRLPARLASAAHSVIAVVRTGRRHVDEYGPLRNVRRPGRRQRACWPRREWRRLAGGCGCAVAARDRAGRYVVAAGSFRNRARPGRCRLRAPVGDRPPSSERMNADGSDPAREV